MATPSAEAADSSMMALRPWWYAFTNDPPCVFLNYGERLTISCSEFVELSHRPEAIQDLCVLRRATRGTPAGPLRVAAVTGAGSGFLSSRPSRARSFEISIAICFLVAGARRGARAAVRGNMSHWASRAFATAA